MRRPRHHLLAIDVRHQFDIDGSVNSAENLVCAVVVGMADEVLAHCKFHISELSIVMVELRIDDVLFE